MSKESDGNGPHHYTYKSCITHRISSSSTRASLCGYNIVVWVGHLSLSVSNRTCLISLWFRACISWLALLVSCMLPFILKHTSEWLKVWRSCLKLFSHVMSVLAIINRDMYNKCSALKLNHLFCVMGWMHGMIHSLSILKRMLELSFCIVSWKWCF